MFEIFFGQFINHDLETDAQNFGIEAAPIANITNDPVFRAQAANPFNPKMLSIMTATPSLGREVSGKFEPVNLGNSWLDLSTIYGLKGDDNKALRTGVNGTLLLQDYIGDGGVYNSKITGVPLPGFPPSASNTSLTPNLPDPTVSSEFIMMSGDGRSSENIQLAIIHTLWIREHNYWAGRMQADHPNWDDEAVYQHARRWTIAEYQHIVFDEYLPAVLGYKMPKYEGYKQDVHVDTSVVFSAAAFRYGHSNVRPYDILDGCTGNPITLHPSYSFPHSHPNRFMFVGKTFPVPVPPYSNFTQGSLDYTPQRMLALASGKNGNGMDNILVSMLRQRSAEFDVMVTSALRHTPGVVDLFAVDISRGRLNGLPDYNTIRSLYHPAGNLYDSWECDPGQSVEDLTCFKLITRNSTIASKLRKIYKKVNKIDAIVGMFAEDRETNAPLPPTISRILREEFLRKRDGDRLWYENTEWFGPDEIPMLKGISMKDIIERNSGVRGVQKNPFKNPGKKLHVLPHTLCAGGASKGSDQATSADSQASDVVPPDAVNKKRGFSHGHDHDSHAHEL